MAPEIHRRDSERTPSELVTVEFALLCRGWSVWRTPNLDVNRMIQGGSETGTADFRLELEIGQYDRHSSLLGCECSSRCSTVNVVTDGSYEDDTGSNY